MRQHYKIAGLNVEMDTFGRTAEQAKPYLTAHAENVDIVINNNLEKAKERLSSDSDDLCEYLSTGANFYMHLINFNGIMLHSSAVVADGKAYLFSAPSGTGKSTHTELWLRAFGDKAYILNDDKPAIRLEDGEFFAYGTPWSGKTDRNTNEKVRLGGICILARGETNEIRRAFGKEAIFGIISQTVRPKDKEYLSKVLELVEKIVCNVPIWHLSCNTDIEAARVSYEAMSGVYIGEFDKEK